MQKKRKKPHIDRMLTSSEKPDLMGGGSSVHRPQKSRPRAGARGGVSLSLPPWFPPSLAIFLSLSLSLSLSRARALSLTHTHSLSLLLSFPLSISLSLSLPLSLVSWCGCEVGWCRQASSEGVCGLAAGGCPGDTGFITHNQDKPWLDARHSARVCVLVGCR